MCTGILCVTLIFIALAGHTQENRTPEYAPKLAQIVHLTLGQTTLAEALAALSKQTGIRIDAMEYLKERVVVVQMEDPTGRTALNALTSLNDLKWKAVGPNHLLVDRPAPKRPEKIADVPPLLAASLPKDVRECLTLGMSKTQAWESADVDPRIFPRRSDSDFHQFVRSKMNEMLQEQRKRLEAGLPAHLAVNGKISFRTLPVAQQSELLTILFLRELNRLSFELLYNDLAPYQKDVMQASLSFQKEGNMLMIGTVTYNGDKRTEEFFGAPITPPPPAGQQPNGKTP